MLQGLEIYIFPGICPRSGYGSAPVRSHVNAGNLGAFQLAIIDWMLHLREIEAQESTFNDEV